ncbi:hypothetical protein [Curtobacterium sp. KT1]|uniref:hypothetical protein n=1 Tax=Curtobacterium sp. KT1 TaxID=3372858 RepID=UPI0037C101DF
MTARSSPGTTNERKTVSARTLVAGANSSASTPTTSAMPPATAVRPTNAVVMIADHRNAAERGKTNARGSSSGRAR